MPSLGRREKKALRRPPPNKLSQILPRRHAQHKPPGRVRHNGEVLFPTRDLALEEAFQLFQRGLHRDERVLPAFAAETHHRFLDAVVLVDRAGRELRFDRRRGDVAEQRFGVRVEHGEVRVVALERREEGLA